MWLLIIFFKKNMINKLPFSQNFKIEILSSRINWKEKKLIKKYIYINKPFYNSSFKENTINNFFFSS